MTFERTDFAGLFLVKPRVFQDERGFFMESFSHDQFVKAGINAAFIQDNHSSSRKGVLRGLHFQNPPHAQTKLVRVISGEVIDIVVDLRRDEPTFGKAYTLTLSAENKIQLLVPKGFAHGFAVISDVAEIVYKCDDYYHPELEGGINILDEAFGLKGLLPKANLIRSEKDIRLPDLAQATFGF